MISIVVDNDRTSARSCCPVADVDLREGVARVSTSLWDRGEIGSVRQLIDVDHVCAGLIEAST